MSDASERLARIVFALLVLACFAAFVVTQRLKHTPTLVQDFKMDPTFTPGSAGPHELEAISFELTKADRVTVTVVSSSGENVATLVRDRPVARYKRLSLRWSGREGIADGYTVLVSPHGYRSLFATLRGPIAPPGEYHVRVSLREQKRTIPSNRDFRLVGR
ncbi:MAG: hypothetical protein ACRDJ3_03790 [Solirubrobacteraceae bacterium]